MRGLIVALALLAAMPASAMAATHYYIPPGNSSANEYVENVPTAGGGSAPLGITPGGGTHPPTGGAGAVSRPTRSGLLRQGRDGAATAAFATASAPVSTQAAGHSHSASKGGKVPSSGTSNIAASGAGTSALGAVARSVTGAGGQSGTSRWLLVILIATALGMAAVALRRRLAR